MEKSARVLINLEMQKQAGRRTGRTTLVEGCTLTSAKMNKTKRELAEPLCW